MQRALGRQVHRVRCTAFLPMHGVEVLAGAQSEVRLGIRRACGGAEQQHRIARFAEAQAHRIFRAFQHAQHANRWRGVDRAELALVVEADIARHDGRLEELAGVGNPAHGLLELVVDFGALWVAEVEAVGNRARVCPDACKVACRLCHRDLPAPIGMQVAVACVAVDSERNPAFGAANAQRGSVARARRHNRLRAHQPVVLLVDPALAGNRGRFEQGQQYSVHVVGARDVVQREALCLFQVGGFVRLQGVGGAVRGEVIG